MAAPASSEVPAVDEPEPPKVKISDDYPDVVLLNSLDEIGGWERECRFDWGTHNSDFIQWTVATQQDISSHRVRGTFSRSMPTAIAIAYLRSFVKSLGYEPVDQVACTT